jgi:hypothetical protein
MALRLLLMGLLSAGSFALVGAAGGTVQNQTTPKEQLKAAVQLSAAGKHAEAEAALAKLVEANPKMPAAWLALGSARHSQKKYDDAIAANRKAAEFPAFAPTALYNVACAHSLQKQTDKAIEALTQAVAAGFADRPQMAKDTDLDHIRKDPRFAGVLPPILEGKDLFAEPTRILHTLVGEGPNHEFGWVARAVGDLDGDKATDFAATAPGFNNHAGKVYVYSGRSGKLLFHRTGQPGQRLGNTVAGAGDVNGDGTPDIITGGPAAGGGIAEILSGKDGTVLHTLTGAQAGGQFGFKVCGLGDIDGDGRADFAVSAPTAAGKQPGSGRVFIYSGKDARVLFTLDGEATGDNFGTGVEASRDAKHPMLAVGAKDAGPGQRGRLYVYHFKGGKPEPAFTVDAEPSGRELGQYFLSFPGDLNRDGVPDVYASDFSDSAKLAGAGRVFVFSGTDGKKLLDLRGTQVGEGFGTSPSDAGDVDGDGVGDLVVGAWQNAEKARSAGKVYLYSGASGKLLTTWTCKQQSDTFGFDAVGLGDVDGDGRADVLLTSAWSAANGPRAGRVFVLACPEFPKR